jgi:hypothetical protein
VAILREVARSYSARRGISYLDKTGTDDASAAGRLLHAAINGLNRIAKKHGVRLRQSYIRIAERAAMMAGRYAHAKQFNRHRRQLRILRTRLGRLIRDIRRKIAGRQDIEAAFEAPLSRASQIRSQQQRQRGWKLYSFHAPETECIGKGKASAPYEFGVKASIVIPNRRAPASRSAASWTRSQSSSLQVDARRHDCLRRDAGRQVRTVGRNSTAVTRMRIRGPIGLAPRRRY